jgi:hypothetical protein
VFVCLALVVLLSLCGGCFTSCVEHNFSEKERHFGIPPFGSFYGNTNRIYAYGEIVTVVGGYTRIGSTPAYMAYDIKDETVSPSGTPIPGRTPPFDILEYPLVKTYGNDGIKHNKSYIERFIEADETIINFGHGRGEWKFIVKNLNDNNNPYTIEITEKRIPLEQEKRSVVLELTYPFMAIGACALDIVTVPVQIAVVCLAFTIGGPTSGGR